MIPAFIDKSKLIHKPGVYTYFDKDGKLLYVGKAIDLNKRISSYFNGQKNSYKTDVMVSQIASVETIVVESELEALILEANLIKKFLPPFNIKLVDDKDYLYIKVTKEEFPRIITCRKTDLKNSLAFFGPFPSSTVVKTTLKRLRQLFPWCSNPPSSQHGLSRSRACFYYHLKLCPGACIGQISVEEYRKIIDRFIKFMEGRRLELEEELQDQMQQSAQKMEYEQAQSIKRILDGIHYITQSTSIKMYLDNPNFVADQNIQAIESLKQALKLPTLPERIECYDISNFQGHQSTGSMVVLTHGEIDKSQYRKFKISITGKPNDYAMHAEMMRRRLKHTEWQLPDLFLIDGGRGQVRAAQDELAKANISRPIYGIAKRMEWLYPPIGDVVKLPKRAFGLRLLQKIRDEAHRFAITYHRKLRAKEFGLST